MRECLAACVSLDWHHILTLAFGMQSEGVNSQEVGGQRGNKKVMKKSSAEADVRST